MSRARNAYAAPSWAAEQTVGDVGTKAVLLTLANYADEHFSCYPGQGTIAEETEQSERTVRRQLELLRELGLVKRTARYSERGKRTSDRYYLILDATSTKEDVKAAKERIAERKKSGVEVPDHDEVDTVNPSESLPANLSGSDSGSTTGQTEPTTGQTLRSLPDTSVRGTPSRTPREELPVPSASRTATEDGSPTGSPKKGTRIPDDFTVTPAMVEWARIETPDVDGRVETANFIDYWAAKPGKDGVKLDWERTWKVWFRRAQEKRATARVNGSRRGYNDKTTWGPRPVEVKQASDQLTDEEADALFGGGRTDGRPARLVHHG